MRFIAMIVATAVLSAVPVAWAQPSIYYLFEQKSTGNTICEPQAPNESWVQIGGPFEDLQCTIAIEE
ncbi:hypothetical protein AGMMS50256_16650 [Betaproteobacteria bacterium]|nr:hypothetical protein AGMMS50256_16650 [Betaproteobacteria bacterium]